MANAYTAVQPVARGIIAAIQWALPGTSGYNPNSLPIGATQGETVQGQIKYDSTTDRYYLRTKFNWEPLTVGDWICKFASGDFVRFTDTIFNLLFEVYP